MSSKPFFSVVMPTRNRAKLLPTAIESVLQQDFEDFELIISDNFSEDNTQEVVSSFDDRRIRYVKTPASLPIDDSFEFALSHVSGKYMTMLPDDDVYTISRLKTGFKIIEDTKTKLLVHKGACYYPDINIKNKPSNLMTIGWFSNLSTSIESKKVVGNFYNKLPDKYYAQSISLPAPFFYSTFPVMINAFYDSEILNLLRTRVPKLFKTRSGDLYLGILFLNQIKDYIYHDAPLEIGRMHSEQTTTRAKANGLNASATSTEAETLFKNVPFKEWTERNVYMDILLEALKDDPSGIGKDTNFNWENYYQICLEDIYNAGNSGVYTDDQVQQLIAHLNELPAELKSNALNAPQNITSKNIFNKALRRVLLSSPVTRIKFLFSKNPDFLYNRSLMLVDSDKTNDLLFYSQLMSEAFIEEIGKFWLGKTKAVPDNWKLY